MIMIAGNLRLGAQGTRRVYLGSTPVFAAEQTRWSTDFSEYATGATPRDWTITAGPNPRNVETFDVTTGGLVSARRLRIRMSAPSGAAQMGFFVWDDLPEVADAEVLMLVQRGASNTVSDLPMAGYRMSLTSATDNAGSALGFRNNSADVTRRFFTNSALSGTQANASHGGTFNANATLWLRARWDGNRYRVKGWPANSTAEDRGLSDEPASWQLDDTNSTISAAGKLGLAQRVARTDAAENEIFVHYFGVGIDGDGAPDPVFVAPGPVPEPRPEPDEVIFYPTSVRNADGGFAIDLQNAAGAPNGLWTSTTAPDLKTFGGIELNAQAPEEFIEPGFVYRVQAFFRLRKPSGETSDKVEFGLIQNGTPILFSTAALSYNGGAGGEFEAQPYTGFSQFNPTQPFFVWVYSGQEFFELEHVRIVVTRSVAPPPPDPGTINTFDSITASFDSTAHTFDEVA